MNANEQKPILEMRGLGKPFLGDKGSDGVDV